MNSVTVTSWPTSNCQPALVKPICQLPDADWPICTKGPPPSRVASQYANLPLPSSSAWTIQLPTC